MTAPTADEILAIINQITLDWPKDNERPDLEEAVRHLFTAIDYRRVDWALPGHAPDPDELGDHVWTDLGPAEAATLHSLVAFAKKRAYRRARAAIVEEVVAAAEAFSRQHPDATRSKVPAVAS